jgi:hypothetical protein
MNGFSMHFFTTYSTFKKLGIFHYKFYEIFSVMSNTHTTSKLFASFDLHYCSIILLFDIENVCETSINASVDAEVN